MDRCALFVDASYVLADGALAVHGTRNRDSVSWDYAGLLKLLGGLSRDRTGLPLLRCYWYDTAADGNRAAEHEALADVPGVKLRLSKARPNRKEGVEAEIRKDLTALARNRAVSDVIIVSAEEDLAPVIAEVQDLGIRTILLHISADGDWAVSRALRQECDDIVDIAAGHLRPYVDLIPGAEPELSVVGYRELATGHAQVSGPQQAIEAPAARIYASPVAAEYDRAEQQLAGLAATGRDQREQLPAQDAARFAQSGADAMGQGQRVADPQSLGQHYQPADASRGQLPATVGGQGGYAPNGFAGHEAGSGQAGNGLVGQQPAGLGQRTSAEDSRGHGGQHAGLQAPHIGSAGMAASAGQQGLVGNGVHAPGLAGNAGQTPGMHAPSQANGMPANGVPPNGMLANGQPAHGGQLAGQPSGAHGHGSMPQPGIQQGGVHQGNQGGVHQGTMAQAGPQHGAGMPGSGLQSGGMPGSGIQSGGMPGNGMPGSGIQNGGMPGSTMSGSTLGQNGLQSASSSQPASGGSQGQGLAMPPGQHQGMPHPQGISAPGQHALQRPGSGQGLPPGGPQPPADQQRQQPQRQLPAGNGMQYPPDRGQYGGQAQGSPYAASPVPSGYPAGSYGAPPPAPMPAPPVAISVGEAVQSAHAEGFGFGEAVARDAPALWLEAVLARKPRMPSDLEARLLQGSALPIDSLLHDEVRHALRRGFWDALERSRH